MRRPLSIKNHVRRLDERKPDWFDHDHVDLGTLDFTGDNCLLAQIFGRFSAYHDRKIGGFSIGIALFADFADNGVFLHNAYRPDWEKAILARRKKAERLQVAAELVELEATHGFGYRVRTRVRRMLRGAA